MACRRFLFLQGVATPFFPVLIKELKAQGHLVHKINFCGGDSLFSWSSDTWRYTNSLERLTPWVKQKHQSHRFTDIVLFGDTRPVHRSLVQSFKQSFRDVNIYVFEEGYLRPNWITLEQGGVNGFSDLISQPTHFWREAATLKEPEPISSRHTFVVRALYDISYRLANAALKPLYPHYETHRPFSALQEYWGWVKRFPAIRFYYNGQDSRKIKRLIKQKTPFYLFPLQVDADAQIREHSPFKGVLESIDCVLRSFAQHAPSDSQLVIKNHPLDTGLLGYNQHVQALVKQLQLDNRIIFLESGHLPSLLKQTQGTVLVNSTTGTSALFHGSPVITLGKAIFDLPGLTFQKGLDRFWIEGSQQKPDAKLFTQFRQKIIALSQINGDFYSREGIKRAVQGSLMKMQVTPVYSSESFEAHRSSVNTLLPENHETLPVSLYGGEVRESPYLYKQP